MSTTTEQRIERDFLYIAPRTIVRLIDGERVYLTTPVQDGKTPIIEYAPTDAPASAEPLPGEAYVTYTDDYGQNRTEWAGAGPDPRGDIARDMIRKKMAKVTAGKIRKAEETRAQWLRDRGWTCTPPEEPIAS